MRPRPRPLCQCQGDDVPSDFSLRLIPCPAPFRTVGGAPCFVLPLSRPLPFFTVLLPSLPLRSLRAASFCSISHSFVRFQRRLLGTACVLTPSCVCSIECHSFRLLNKRFSPRRLGQTDWRRNTERTDPNVKRKHHDRCVHFVPNPLRFDSPDHKNRNTRSNHASKERTRSSHLLRSKQLVAWLK